MSGSCRVTLRNVVIGPSERKRTCTTRLSNPPGSAGRAFIASHVSDGHEVGMTRFYDHLPVPVRSNEDLSAQRTSNLGADALQELAQLSNVHLKLLDDRGSQSSELRRGSQHRLAREAACARCWQCQQGVCSQRAGG